jgi:CSN8/PSMD8/EIF3K family
MKQQQHPAIQFCSRLEQHLMIGSYDQVMEAAAHPPVEYYSFLLKSLLETVRINIAECVAASYQIVSITALTKLLMFSADKVI